MSTIEQEPPRLYAAREPIFPRRVRGKFRNLKWVLMAVTLGIYYITPWIRWDRGPGLPDQAVLRLFLPSDRLDRPLHDGRAPDRGRPQRPHPPV